MMEQLRLPLPPTREELANVARLLAEQYLDITQERAELVLRVTKAPTEEGLRRLANTIADVSWRIAAHAEIDHHLGRGAAAHAELDHHLGGGVTR